MTDNQTFGAVTPQRRISTLSQSPLRLGLTAYDGQRPLCKGESVSDHRPPQPDPSRLTPFAGNAVVVAITPRQPPLVLLTAAALAEAVGGPLYCAYVDIARYTDEEYPDGTVRHLPLNPDTADDSWARVEQDLTARIEQTLAGRNLEWHFRYLAGRVDRSLTHLARHVNAATIVVGTHNRHTHRVSEFVSGALGVQLSHRQHRPVLVVPLAVVDWRGKAPWE